MSRKISLHRPKIDTFVPSLSTRISKRSLLSFNKQAANSTRELRDDDKGLLRLDGEANNDRSFGDLERSQSLRGFGESSFSDFAKTVNFDSPQPATTSETDDVDGSDGSMLDVVEEKRGPAFRKNFLPKKVRSLRQMTIRQAVLLESNSNFDQSATLGIGEPTDEFDASFSDLGRSHEPRHSEELPDETKISDNDDRFGLPKKMLRNMGQLKPSPAMLNPLKAPQALFGQLKPNQQQVLLESESDLTYDHSSNDPDDDDVNNVTEYCSGEKKGFQKKMLSLLGANKDCGNNSAFEGTESSETFHDLENEEISESQFEEYDDDEEGDDVPSELDPATHRTENNVLALIKADMESKEALRKASVESSGSKSRRRTRVSKPDSSRRSSNKTKSEGSDSRRKQSRSKPTDQATTSRRSQESSPRKSTASSRGRLSSRANRMRGSSSRSRTRRSSRALLTQKKQQSSGATPVQDSNVKIVDGSDANTTHAELNVDTLQ